MLEQKLKQFPVRYGRNYKVVLAMVLPALLIAPFIIMMQAYKTLEEWKIWVIIFVFLGIVIFSSIWLVLRIYPKILLRIDDNEIQMSFNNSNFLSPVDFRFNISDITSFTHRTIGDEGYFVFEIRNPYRKFQISSASYQLEDLLAFNEAMFEISEKINSPHN